MDIYTALKKDHEKVDALLEQLVSASEQGDDKWKEVVKQIRDELIPHARAEEALFYNPIRDAEHGKDVVGHAYGEHAMAETELRTLQAMSAIDANWTTLAKKLREDIRHHVEEEESKVFAAGRVVFSEQEAESIGEAFEALKPYVKDQSIVGTSYDLILNMLPKSIREKLPKMFSGSEKKSA